MTRKNKGAIDERELREAIKRFGLLPTTRQEAIDRRIDKYFTGKPCSNGHLSPRYTKWGTCVACAAASSLRRAEEAKRALDGGEMRLAEVSHELD
jgi:hypothetical protein